MKFHGYEKYGSEGADYADQAAVFSDAVALKSNKKKFDIGLWFEREGNK